MAKKIKGKKIIIGVVLVVIILSVIFFFGIKSGEEYNREEVDNFAKCLTEKGAVMYGAFWCPHCARTKKKFGESFQFINYVECDPRGENEQSLLCLDKKIDSYDTWEFNDDYDSRLIGEPSFEALASSTGCVLPRKK
ncbi:MAG: hypothetical protein AABW89_03780 [Nanoarchaeota archaeon]